MRVLPALLLPVFLTFASLASGAESPPPAAPPATAATPATTATATTPKAATAATPAAAASPPPAMMMRILDEQKSGAQIHEAERAEQLAEQKRRQEAERKFLLKGLQMSIDLALHLARYAGWIILSVVIAGALGAALAYFNSRRRQFRRYDEQ